MIFDQSLKRMIKTLCIFTLLYTIAGFAAPYNEISEYKATDAQGNTKNKLAAGQTHETQSGSGAFRWRTEGYTIHPLDASPEMVEKLMQAGNLEPTAFDFPYTAGQLKSAYAIIPRSQLINEFDVQRGNIAQHYSLFTSDLVRYYKNENGSAATSDNALNALNKLIEQIDDPSLPLAFESNGFMIEFIYPNYPSTAVATKYGGYDDRLGHYFGKIYGVEPGLITQTSVVNTVDGPNEDITGICADFSRNTETQSLGIKHRLNLRYARTVPVLPKQPDNPNPETETDTTSGRTGKDKPDLYTYHTSNQFDVGRGIPSSESMENGFGANKWYGFYAWKGKKKTKDFTATYTVSGQYKPRVIVGYHSCSNPNCSRDGDPIYGYRWRSYGTKTITMTTQRSASYYGINQIEIYQLKNINVQNGSYGQVSYDPGVSIPVTAFIRHTGFAANDPVTTYQGTYDVTDTGHIERPANSVHDGNYTPIKITDAEVKTQLQKESVIPENGPDGDTPAYKLLLDGTYTVEFQPKQWFSAEFGKDSPMKGYENGQWMIGGENADSDDTADRYDKYVNDKKIRFPFPAQAQSEDNEMVYYPLKDDDYTDWISFPNNTIKFYVPTWVQENKSFILTIITMFRIS